MVTLALIPYLALSAALDPLVPIISEQLHMTTQAMSLSSGLGNDDAGVTIAGVPVEGVRPRGVVSGAMLLYLRRGAYALGRPRAIAAWWRGWPTRPG
jgi:hypothetical protein